VNLHEHVEAPNVNLITCGGQATIPMVNAVSRVVPGGQEDQLIDIALELQREGAAVTV